MIFDEIVREVAERLDLSSNDALSRIGREVNARYRRITASIGLQATRRTQASATAAIGSNLITFTGITKVEGVYSTDTPPRPLQETTVVDLRQRGIVGNQPPSCWAVHRAHATSVEVLLDCTASTTFTLNADGYVALTTLSGSDIPDLPEDFHDILIFGALADEYRKSEKVQLYRDAETDFEKRLADLRFFIVKSSWLDLYQGKQRQAWPYRYGTFAR